MRVRVLALLLLVISPAFAQEQPACSPQRAATIEKLRSLVVVSLPEWRFHDGDLREGASTALDDSQWETIRLGDKRKYGPAWFRTWVEVPKAIHGWDPSGATVRLNLRPGWYELMYVYANGAQLGGGEEGDPIVLTNNARPGDRYLIAVRTTGEPSERGLTRSQMEFEAPRSRPDPGRFHEEIASAEAVLAGYAQEKGKFDPQLDAALAMLDYAALARGDQQAFDASLDKARASLGDLRSWLRQFTIMAAGNSHIDMAWLWPWTETVDVVKRTFGSALQLMREFPDLTFTMASARTYAWMEEKYPDLFRELQQRVKEGRWEPIGGMWVEPDLNLPDGESLVRQVLVGKRYFKEKFGVDIRTGWNPDSFGYNWQLPQIYKKSGMDYFVTQKISWNDTNKFPHKLFWWEAPDGSRILTYFPRDYANRLSATRMAEDVPILAPATYSNTILHLFGVGDHGGGPTRNMLEIATRFAQPDSIYPNLKLGPVQPFLDAIGKSPAAQQAPVWRDELYLEYHRGTYTTQGRTKRNNRKNEVLLLNAEKFASLAGGAYPKAELDHAWRTLLFNQFHDILPGSSVGAVYKDADRDHADVRRTAGLVLENSLEALAGSIDTRGPGVPVVVFNALSWPHSGLVEAEVSLPAPARTVRVRAANGQPALAEELENHGSRVRVRFFAPQVPSLGYAVFHVEPAGAGAPDSAVRAGAGTIENEFLRVRVDQKTGCITSIFDTRNQREVLAEGACGGELQFFRDKPKNWDAWDIDAEALEQRLEGGRTESVEPVKGGPMRAVIRVRRKFQDSTFTHDITLAAGVPRLDIQTSADWHEKHVLAKVAFPVAVRSPQATYEIPFGSIQRPTTRNTPVEKAKFEVPALRWADLNDGKYGVSLLNDCKYGHDTRDNVMRLSLLRSPENPDPHADEGKHEFAYSIYPHAGDWIAGETVRRGYELNNPLIAVATSAHSGRMPATQALVTVDAPNVVLSAVKRAEDEASLVLRLYEFAGKPAQARVEFERPPAGAMEVDLMEKTVAPLNASGSGVTVSLRPYEIKTLRVALK